MRDDFGHKSEDVALQTLLSISAASSIAGSLFMLHELHRRAHTHSLLASDHMLVVLATLDLLVSLAMIFGRAFIPAADEHPSGWCVAQAVGIELFGLAAIIWTALISLTMVLSLWPGQSVLSGGAAPRDTARALVLTFTVAGGCTAALGGIDGYGDAVLWCWVRANRPVWQLGFYYLPLLLAWAVCVVSLLAVRRQLRRRLGDAYAKTQLYRDDSAVTASGSCFPAAELSGCSAFSGDGSGMPLASLDATRGQAGAVSFGDGSAATAQRAAVVDQVVLQTTRYLIVFTAFYFFGLLNRLTNYILASMGSRPYVFPLYLLQAVFTPLQGFGNALVYGGLYTKLQTFLCNGSFASTLASFQRHLTAPLELLGRDTQRRVVIAPLLAPDICASDHATAADAADAAAAASSEPPSSASSSAAAAAAAAAAGGFSSSEGSGEDAAGRCLPPLQLASYAIFAATWNMGEAATPSAVQLAEWLPPKQHVYAFSLQECLAVDEFVAEALAAVSVTGSYISYVKRLGSSRRALGSHGCT